MGIDMRGVGPRSVVIRLKYWVHHSGLSGLEENQL